MKKKEIVSPGFTKEQRNKARIVLETLMLGQSVPVGEEDSMEIMLAEKEEGGVAVVMLAESNGVKDHVLGIEMPFNTFIEKAANISDDKAFALSSGNALLKEATEKEEVSNG